LSQKFWTLRLLKCQEEILQVIKNIGRPIAQEPNSEEFVDEDFRLAFDITEYFERSGIRMHILFKDITHGLLGGAVTQNVTPPSGAKALEERLFRRLKRLL
jgi:hypothetical protein